MIAVLGGTGMTGREVVKSLQAAGADFRCIVRDPAKAAETLGADVALVAGDVNDPASIEAGCAGADKLFILVGHSPSLAEQQNNAIDAAKRAGVGDIVKLSGGKDFSVPDGPAKIPAMHGVSDNYLRTSGVDWTLLHPGFFMSNLLNAAPMVKGMGKVVMPMSGEVPIAFVDPRDTADVAAATLTGDGHAGQAYQIFSESSTLNEFVAAIGSALGKEMPYIQAPPEGARKAMEERGMPDWLIEHQLALSAIANEGTMGGTNDVVATVAGHPPRTIVGWIADNIGAFQG